MKDKCKISEYRENYFQAARKIDSGCDLLLSIFLNMLLKSNKFIYWNFLKRKLQFSRRIINLMKLKNYSNNNRTGKKSTNKISNYFGARIIMELWKIKRIGIFMF